MKFENTVYDIDYLLAVIVRYEAYYDIKNFISNLNLKNQIITQIKNNKKKYNKYKVQAISKKLNCSRNYVYKVIIEKKL